MIAFFLPGYDHLEPFFEQAGMAVGSYEVARFPDGELGVGLGNNVAAKRCFIVGTIAPPETNLAVVTMLAHNLKAGGADDVMAVLPYLAYSRQDKAASTEAPAVAWAGKLLAASGVHEIITIELHSDKDVALLPLPVVSISPIHYLLDYALPNHGTGVTLVAVDRGRMARVKELAAAAHIAQVATLTEIGDSGDDHLEATGQVTDTCLVFDDILDTGQTMIAAARELRERGAKNIYCMVAHALFTGTTWQELWELNVRGIICLDTVPSVREIRDHRIEVIPCGPLLSSHMTEGDWR